ncbi:Uncharacterized protein Rs2_50495 [Raphanus sativus]|nr:Uncharacterized protein Rs2_50495 [Raphanus sativus]
MQDKRHEADSLLTKLNELEEVAEILKTEQEDAQASLNERHSKSSGEAVILPYWKGKDGADTEAMKFSYATEWLMEKVQELERSWVVKQERALKQPSPAQREKRLDKQLHTLIEQLSAKQVEADEIAGEIHSSEMELERLNSLWRRYGSFNVEGNAARNKFKITNSDKDLDQTMRLMLIPTFRKLLQEMRRKQGLCISAKYHSKYQSVEVALLVPCPSASVSNPSSSICSIRNHPSSECCSQKYDIAKVSTN